MRRGRRQSKNLRIALFQYVSSILFTGRGEAEAFTTERDRAGNGAVANLLTIFTQADYRQLRAGRRFDIGAGTPAA